MSFVLRSHKDKENVEVKGKNSPGKNIDGATTRPVKTKRTFGKCVQSLSAGPFTVLINYFWGSRKSRIKTQALSKWQGKLELMFGDQTFFH